MRIFWFKTSVFFFLLGISLGISRAYAQENKELTKELTKEVTLEPPSNNSRRYSEEDEEVFPVESPSLRQEEVFGSKSEVKLNLNDCVQMALLNNKEIKATKYDVKTAEYKLKEAQPRGVPTIEYDLLSAPAPRDVNNAVGSFFSGNITYFQKGRITIGSPLYTFGKIGLAQDLAVQGILAEKQKRFQKQNEVVLKVKQLYYGILLSKDLSKLLKDAADHLEEEVNRESEEGEEPRNPVEVVRLKLYRFEILSRLSQLEKRTHMAYHALRIQMGLPRGTEFKIMEEHLNPVRFQLKNLEGYLSQSRKFRPKNQLVKIGLRAKELEYRLERRKITPNIGIGGIFEFGVTTNSIQGLQLTDDFNNPFNFTRVGFGLRINGEFNVKSYLAKVNQKQAEYFKVAIEKQAADEGLDLDIRDAYEDVKQNAGNLKNSRQAMKTARQFVFLTKTNIDIGVGSKTEYSDALQAYLLSRGRYLEAILNYNLAVATLEQKLGGFAQIQAEMR